VNVERLADAYDAREIDKLLPYCEIVEGGRTGTVLHWRPEVGSLVMNEVFARPERARREREDLAARSEGYKNADQAIVAMKSMPGEIAGPLYFRIFGG
jgi:hypothetical protein